MATILCISPQRENPLPPLEVLGHQLQLIDFEPQSLALAPRHDLIVLDCRRNLVEARAVARILQAANWQTPLLLVVSESGLPAVSGDWGSQDFILDGASLAEVDARIRLLARANKTLPLQKVLGGLVIDVTTFTAKINGKALDLTYKEFELLRYLQEHPSQVFTREQLLSEVWGYDYFGGTRTVDVHIRRLRAKLGEFEGLIGTVRNVGYRLDPSGNSEN
jgi:DNA-binding response OmpR family regulator